MCTIAINPASIVAVPIGTLGTLVTVSGTVSNCTSNNIKVTVACPGSSVFAGAVVTGNSWTAQVDPRCICGTPVTITATCEDSPPCTATLNTVLNCGCCPQIHTSVNLGLCNSSGQQLVTFMTSLNFPAGCTVTVQRDFGDGTSGTIQTFTSLPNPNPYAETHAYNLGSGYTSTLKVLSQASCGLSSVGVVLSPTCPLCAINSFISAACKLGQLLFLVFGAAASILLIAATSAVCVTANGALVPTAGGYAITAGITFGLLILFCRKCICGFFLKMFAQLLIIVGAVLFMFVLPLNCMQPLPFPTPFSALGLASLVLVVGVFGVLYASWYNSPPGFKDICPLTICNFWQAVKDALLFAILAAFLVYGSLAMGLLWTHLGFDLLVITLILIPSVDSQIIINQNAHKC
jgi:hypothetical protein